MAKKTTAKQNTNNGESKFKGIRNFFTSERTRFITGLVISIVTIYVGLALISFFFTGGADQSKIENIPLSDLVINRGSVENWTGVRGAFLADLLMNRWFGISSFLILFFLGSVGAKLMNLSRVSLLKRFLFSAAMLIWGSLFFAFIFIRGYEDTFIYLGGQHGYYLSEVMMNNIGIPGTVLLLVGLFLIVAIFTSKRTIPFLQNVFSFGWLKNRLKRDKCRKRKKMWKGKQRFMLLLKKRRLPLSLLHIVRQWKKTSGRTSMFSIRKPRCGKPRWKRKSRKRMILNLK